MDMVDRAVSRLRIFTAIRATERLERVMPEGMMADEALSVFNLALDNIVDPGIRRTLTDRVERAGHDMSAWRPGL